MREKPMYVTQVYTRDAFLKKAANREIRVLRSQTLNPVTTASGAVMMQPAIEIQYVVNYDDPVEGESSVVFREIRLPDAQGKIDFGGTLLEQLSQSHLPHVILHRTGSI